MTEPRDDGVDDVDPRFAAVFQRGYDPARHPDAVGAPPPADPFAPYPVDEAADPAEAGLDRLDRRVGASGETFAPGEALSSSGKLWPGEPVETPTSRRPNPWLIVMAALGVALLVTGALLVRAVTEATGGATAIGARPDRFTQLLLTTLTPGLFLVGALALAASVALYALFHAGDQRRDPRPDDEDVADGPH